MNKVSSRWTEGEEKDGGWSLAYRQPSVKVVGDTRNRTRELGKKLERNRGSSVSLCSAKAEDWSTENIGQGGGQEEGRKGAGKRRGGRVVERWKVEKRRQ